MADEEEEEEVEKRGAAGGAAPMQGRAAVAVACIRLVARARAARRVRADMVCVGVGVWVGCGREGSGCPRAGEAG